MMSLRKTAIAALASVSVASAGLVAPALAAPAGFDAAKLDNAPAEYSQYRGYRGGYRGGWHRGNNRGAAIAAGVGLGILGAAAIASSRRAYADPYYYDDGYETYAPVYAPAPVYRRHYQPSYDFRDHR